MKIVDLLTKAISKHAVKNWKLQTFKQEWLFVILLVLVLKLATSAVSIFSGWYYLTDFFADFVPNDFLAKLLSVIALLLIECLTALFLAKFFKFALRLNFLQSLMPLICVSGIFAVSFIVSTNGIATYVNTSDTQIESVKTDYLTLKNAVNEELTENINTVKMQIANINANPENWKDGKRCVLSKEQNQQINKCFEQITKFKQDAAAKIADIEKQEQSEIANTKQTINATAEKYYKIVMHIMIVQVLSSAILWFFYSKIAIEEAPQDQYNENLNHLFLQTDKIIERNFENRINSRIFALENVINNTKPTMQTQINANADVKKNASNKVSIKGFGGNSENISRETDENISVSRETNEKNSVNDAVNIVVNDNFNANTASVLNVSENLTPKCQFCGKELTIAQVSRRAKYCCPSCRVKAFNATHSKKIDIKDSSLT